MNSEVRDLAYKADDWVQWYNSNKPTEGSGIPERVKFLELAVYGCLEIMVRLTDVAYRNDTLTPDRTILLPTGFKFEE